MRIRRLRPKMVLKGLKISKNGGSKPEFSIFVILPTLRIDSIRYPRHVIARLSSYHIQRSKTKLAE